MKNVNYMTMAIKLLPAHRINHFSSPAPSSTSPVEAYGIIHRTSLLKVQKRFDAATNSTTEKN